MAQKTYNNCVRVPFTFVISTEDVVASIALGLHLSKSTKPQPFTMDKGLAYLHDTLYYQGYDCAVGDLAADAQQKIEDKSLFTKARALMEEWGIEPITEGELI